MLRSFFVLLIALVLSQPLEVEEQNVKQLDVAFVLDTTGSMGSLIKGAQKNIGNTVEEIRKHYGNCDIRLGIIGFRDRGDRYVTKFLDFQTKENYDVFFERLNSFQARGGGDFPESVNLALFQAVNSMSWSELSEEEGVYKLIFLVGDAPPHMYEDEIHYPEICQDAKFNEIVINAFQCGSDVPTKEHFSKIAQLGGGEYKTINCQSKEDVHIRHHGTRPVDGSFASPTTFHVDGSFTSPKMRKRAMGADSDLDYGSARAAYIMSEASAYMATDSGPSTAPPTFPTTMPTTNPSTAPSTFPTTNPSTIPTTAPSEYMVRPSSAPVSAPLGEVEKTNMDFADSVSSIIFNSIPVTRKSKKKIEEKEDVQKTKTKTIGETEEKKEAMMGATRDEHGCIPSAGYMWSEEKNKCVRPWEEKEEL